METQLLAILSELNKTDFDNDFDSYITGLKKELSVSGLDKKTVSNITYFFEHVFFKDSDYTIVCDFKKHINKTKYIDVINNSDLILKNVLLMGNKYNWPRHPNV